MTCNGENDVLNFSFDLIFVKLAGNEDSIQSLTSSNFCQVGLLPSEFGALMHLKNGKASTFIFYRILVKLAGNQDRHEISDNKSEQSLWSYVPLSTKIIPYIFTQVL